MSDRKEFEDWFFSPSNSMSMSDIDVAWEAWQVSAQRPQAVPMTDEQVDSFSVDGRLHWLGKRQLIRAVEAHYGITAQCANTTKKEPS